MVGEGNVQGCYRIRRLKMLVRFHICLWFHNINNISITEYQPLTKINLQTFANNPQHIANIIKIQIKANSNTKLHS